MVYIRRFHCIEAMHAGLKMRDLRFEVSQMVADGRKPCNNALCIGFSSENVTKILVAVAAQVAVS